MAKRAKKFSVKSMITSLMMCGATSARSAVHGSTMAALMQSRTLIMAR